MNRDSPGLLNESTAPVGCVDSGSQPTERGRAVSAGQRLSHPLGSPVEGVQPSRPLHFPACLGAKHVAPACALTPLRGGGQHS